MIVLDLAGSVLGLGESMLQTAIAGCCAPDMGHLRAHELLSRDYRVPLGL